MPFFWVADKNKAAGWRTLTRRPLTAVGDARSCGMFHRYFPISSTRPFALEPRREAGTVSGVDIEQIESTGIRLAAHELPAGSGPSTASLSSSPHAEPSGTGVIGCASISCSHARQLRPPASDNSIGIRRLRDALRASGNRWPRLKLCGNSDFSRTLPRLASFFAECRGTNDIRSPDVGGHRSRFQSRCCESSLLL